MVSNPTIGIDTTSVTKPFHTKVHNNNNNNNMYISLKLIAINTKVHHHDNNNNTMYLSQTLGES